MQSGVSISNSGVSGQRSVVSGTLKYVSDYTGFSGNAEEQEGNYFAFRVDTEDENDVITCELLGGRLGHPVTLDPDRNIVFKIGNPKTQKIRVVVTHTNADESTVTSSTTIDLSGLILEPAPEET